MISIPGSLSFVMSTAPAKKSAGDARYALSGGYQGPVKIELFIYCQFTGHRPAQRGSARTELVGPCEVQLFKDPECWSGRGFSPSPMLNQANSTVISKET